MPSCPGASQPCGQLASQQRWFLASGDDEDDDDDDEEDDGEDGGDDEDGDEDGGDEASILMPIWGQADKLPVSKSWEVIQ